MDEREQSAWAAAVQALRQRFADHFSGQCDISVHAGWLPILNALCERVGEELTPFERRRFRWSQIKQKWGELRAYFDLDGELARVHVDIACPGELVHMVSGMDDPLATKIDALIAEAVEKAATTCEYCGAPGRRSQASSGYVHVACETHKQGIDRGARGEPDQV